MKKYMMILVMSVMFLSGCESKTPEELMPGKSGRIEDSTSNDSAGAEGGYDLSVNGSNIYSLNQNIIIDGIEFKDMDVEFMKELPANVPKDEVIYFDEIADEDGKLTSSDSYIFSAISIKNMNPEEQTVYLSCGQFCVYNEKNEIIARNSELRYRSNYNGEDPIKKDYYSEVFAPNEEKKFLLGYLVPDNMLEQGNLYFTINLYGDMNDKESLMAYKIY